MEKQLQRCEWSTPALIDVDKTYADVDKGGASTDSFGSPDLLS